MLRSIIFVAFLAVYAEGCAYWCKSQCVMPGTTTFYCCSFDPLGRPESFIEEDCDLCPNQLGVNYNCQSQPQSCSQGCGTNQICCNSCGQSNVCVDKYRFTSNPSYPYTQYANTQQYTYQQYSNPPVYSQQYSTQYTGK